MSCVKHIYFPASLTTICYIKENESDRINIKDDMEVECVAVIFIFSIVVSTLIFNKKPPNNPHGSKPTKHIPTEMT
jgi:hypothetical protein